MRGVEKDTRYLAFSIVAAFLLLFFFLNSSGFLTPEKEDLPAKTFPGLPVDLNSAGPEDLVILPGIGEKTALRIIEEREKKGGFQSIEELLEVKWISEDKLEKLRPFVTVKEKAGRTD